MFRIVVQRILSAFHTSGYVLLHLLVKSQMLLKDINLIWSGKLSVFVVLLGYGSESELLFYEVNGCVSA
jgi:hypothetical protein